MTPERAKELINLSSFGELPYAFIPHGSMDTYPVRSCGITEAEWGHVKALWKTMPGHTCFNDALIRIAKRDNL